MIKSAGIDNAEGVGKENGLLKIEGLPALPPWCPRLSFQKAKEVFSCDVNTALVYSRQTKLTFKTLEKGWAAFNFS